GTARVDAAREAGTLRLVGTGSRERRLGIVGAGRDLVGLIADVVQRLAVVGLRADAGLDGVSQTPGPMKNTVDRTAYGRVVEHPGRAAVRRRESRNYRRGDVTDASAGQLYAGRGERAFRGLPGRRDDGDGGCRV